MQAFAEKALANSPGSLERVRSAVRAVSEVMFHHQEEILRIYRDSHLLDGKSRRVILARVEEFIGMVDFLSRGLGSTEPIARKSPSTR